jgi:hypothetical protein
LTIKNTEEIAPGFAHLLKSFRKLRSKKLWKSNVAGGAFVLEVTGVPGNWHCHLHAVIQSRYIPQAQLSRAWLNVSGAVYVWIKRTATNRIVAYLTKYLAKPSVLEEHELDVSHCLTGFRLFQPFGSWLKISCFIQKKPFFCERCGQSAWIPLDIWYLHFNDHPACCLSPPMNPEDRGDMEGDENHPLPPIFFDLPTESLPLTA